jgi:hypothetical protein
MFNQLILKSGLIVVLTRKSDPSNHNHTNFPKF